MARRKKGTPTPLNLWVLGDIFGTATRVPNRIRPTSANAMRRCMRAGLFTVDGGDLVLTDEGVAAVVAGR